MPNIHRTAYGWVTEDLKDVARDIEALALGTSESITEVEATLCHAHLTKILRNLILATRIAKGEWSPLSLQIPSYLQNIKRHKSYVSMLIVYMLTQGQEGFSSNPLKIPALPIECWPCCYSRLKQSMCSVRLLIIGPSLQAPHADNPQLSPFLQESLGAFCLPGQ